MTKNMARFAGGLAMALLLAPHGYCIFGVGDVVIVGANPADAAAWAKQGADMQKSITEARNMVQAANKVVSYAGNPADAIKNIGDLARIAQITSEIIGPGQTATELVNVSETLRIADRANQTAQQNMVLLKGLQNDISVFGSPQSRQTDLYGTLYAMKTISQGVRDNREKVSNAINAIDKALNDNADKLKNAATENDRAAVMAERAVLEGKRASAAADEQRIIATGIEQEKEANQLIVEKALNKVEQKDAEGAAATAAVNGHMEANREKVSTSLKGMKDAPTDWNSGLKVHFIPPVD